LYGVTAKNGKAFAADHTGQADPWLGLAWSLVSYSCLSRGKFEPICAVCVLHHGC